MFQFNTIRMSNRKMLDQKLQIGIMKDVRCMHFPEEIAWE